MDLIEPPYVADESTMLAAFLDYQRAVLLRKADGLSKEQLNATLPTSSLSLAGLLKHAAFVEDIWFQECFVGTPLGEPWASAPFADDRDWDFHSAEVDDPDYLVGLYTSACEKSREIVASAESFDQLSTSPRHASTTHVSLRWIVIHMIEETARHLGHADLLREAIDGTLGD
jgi:hypothetical protein